MLKAGALQRGFTVIHFAMNEGVSEMNKQANKGAVRANEQTDDRVAQYFCLD